MNCFFFEILFFWLQSQIQIFLNFFKKLNEFWRKKLKRTSFRYNNQDVKYTFHCDWNERSWFYLFTLEFVSNNKISCILQNLKFWKVTFCIFKISFTLMFPYSDWKRIVKVIVLLLLFQFLISTMFWNIPISWKMAVHRFRWAGTCDRDKR